MKLTILETIKCVLTIKNFQIKKLHKNYVRKINEALEDNNELSGKKDVWDLGWPTKDENDQIKKKSA